MGPPPPDAAPRKPTRLLFWLGCTGCLFAVLLVAVGGTMGYLLFRANAKPDRVLAPHWRDSLRVRYRLPEAFARLPLPAPDRAAATDAMLWPPGSDSVLRTRTLALRTLQRGEPLDAAGRAALDGVLRDTMLARLAPYAGRAGDAVLASLADPPGRPLLMWPAGAGFAVPFMGASRLGTMLLLRGEARAARGDRHGARADFGASLALGRRVYTTVPSAIGVSVGARIMGEGAAALGRLAASVRDSALARDAAAVADWTRAVRRGAFYGNLAPDTTILLAGDTALPRGVRAAALEWTVSGSVFASPWYLVRGPSRAIARQVRALQTDGDPVIARLAVIADSSVSRLASAGISGRFHLATGRPLH
jgi:hypothetical protein